MKKTIILIIFIIVLSLFPLYQLYALNNVALQNTKIESFTMNRYLQFEIQGTAELYNPSLIPITINNIYYSGSIKDQEVFEGTMTGMTIRAGEAVQFPFAEEIDWVPDQETVVEILQGKNVTLIINTKTHVSYLYLLTLTGEKEINIPLTTVVRPYVEEQVAVVSEFLVTQFW